MTKEYDMENNIKCPHCGYENPDSWELGGEDGYEDIITCGSCEKEFNMSVSVSVTYSSWVSDCADRGHEYDVPRYLDYPAVGTPFRVWTRYCKNCTRVESKMVELGGDNPFIGE